MRDLHPCLEEISGATINIDDADVPITHMGWDGQDLLVRTSDEVTHRYKNSYAIRDNVQELLDRDGGPGIETFKFNFKHFGGSE